MKFSANAPKVLYEDNHLLALDKPAGLLTQPNGTDADSLEEQGKRHLKQKCQKPGNVFLHPIHRLDKPVSGIVLFARTSKALSRLNEAMRSRQLTKIYHAEVEGHLENPAGELTHFLIHSSHRAAVATNGQGKKAVLTYRTLKTYPHSTLLEVTLHTGRYHQIRIQLSHIGHPIIGDTKYGAKPSARLALHHAALTFPHPITQQEITVTSK
ncbi:MAG: RluA family pseudouridine synthase [Chlamydiia bacterium]|nr:RluA family pseudouridine synthase [Chlamydiia bacterium]